MAHWKSMTDRKYMYAFDLGGRDVTVTIDKVEAGELNNGTQKNKKPLAYFRESKSGKPLALNATNCKTIAAMYGNDTDDWIGKRVTLFPTTTHSPEGQVECIRIRPNKPAAKGQRPPEPPPETGDREPGEEG